MGKFFDFFYEFIMLVLYNIAEFFVAVYNAFASVVLDFKEYYDMIMSSSKDFDVITWILAILSIIIVAAAFGLLYYKLFRLLSKYFVFRRKAMEEEELLKELQRLNREVVRLVDEKNKIMAMKVSQLGLKPGEDLDNAAALGDGSGSGTKNDGGASRFVKLISVDKKYEETPFALEDPQDYTLSDLVDAFRNFSCSRMRLFYERKLIMYFIAGMATSRLIILEGISGTGKTSLPYSFGKFLKHDSAICAVQPSWRDRSELIGYLNEFTKRFNETDFLKSVYDFTFRDDIGFIVLDEMNLARIEYYFADVLSVLEMPDPNEWKLDIVPDTWSSDPIHIYEGKCQLPTNVWFVGTANNDDSTFTITDKVYDRATSIQINTKGADFDCPDHGPMQVSSEYLNGMFKEAKEKYPVSEDTLSKLDVLDYYVIENFRLAFGNRILKQIKDFVPVFVACGGTELDGLDYMLTYKIFRKFEGLNVAFMQDNMKKLVVYLEKTFGKGKMPLAKAYLERIMKMG